MQIKTIGDITMIESGLQVVYLDEKDMRYLIAWIAKNRINLLCEIACEECPEHIGEMERKAYVLNECERGHKA